MSKYFILEKHSDSCYSVWTYPSKQKFLGDIIFDISAGWVYCLAEDAWTGYYTSEFLRAIADKLDELNAELFEDMK